MPNFIVIRLAVKGKKKHSSKRTNFLIHNISKIMIELEIMPFNCMFTRFEIIVNDYFHLSKVTYHGYDTNGRRCKGDFSFL